MRLYMTSTSKIKNAENNKNRGIHPRSYDHTDRPRWKTRNQQYAVGAYFRAVFAFRNGTATHETLVKKQEHLRNRSAVVAFSKFQNCV